MKREMESIRTQALKSIQELSRVTTRMILIEKSLSESTRKEIHEPICKMDWAEKDKYARELITILETSKSEAEILERAEAARR